MKVLLLFFSVVVYPLVPQALALDDMNIDYRPTKYVTKYRPEYRYNFSYDLGDTTNFYLPSIQLKPSVVDCDNDSNKGLRIDPKVSAFANIGDEIAGLSACETIKSDDINRFSEENCRLTVACSKVKMNKDEGNLMSFFTIPKMISEDFVGMTLEKNIVKMGKFDALRKFAEQKFGKNIGEICSPRFNHVYEPEAIDTCDSSVVDSGFVRLQESCSLTRESCYNSGINDPQKDFNVFLKLNPPLKESESALQLFMDKRTDGMVSNSLANDREMLESLSAIISSKDNKDIKLQNIFNKLVDYRTQGKLDPLFGFLTDFDSPTGVFKNSSHYSFFEKLVLSNSSAESTRSSIEKYRMETSKKILNEECDITPSFASICKDATAVLKSKRILVPDKKFASFRIARDSDDIRYAMLKSLYPNGIQTLADFSIVMEAQRCKAFGFSAPKTDFEKHREMAAGSNDTSSMFDQVNTPFQYGFGLRLEQDDTVGAFTRSAFRYKPEETKEPTFGPVDANHPLVKEKEPVPGIVQGAALTDEELKARSASSDKVERKFDSLSENLSEGLQHSANVAHSAGVNTSNGFLNGSSFNNLNHSMVGKNSESDDYSDSSMDKEKKSKSKSSSDSLNDKIFELSRKLSTSEDNLERIKAEKEEAQQEKEKQIKIDEENKTIAELKNQIKSFKAEAKKEADSSATTRKDTDSEAGAASLSSSMNSMKAQSEAKSSSQETAQAATVHNQSNTSNSGSSASSEGSSGTQNSASARSTINAGASNAVSSDFKTSLVFTKIDDLSVEKASEQIYAKILELKGAPFYIEEGGVVKEIIPKVVNDVVVMDKFGMPVYEKVIVSEKDKMAKLTKKGKTPASISTKADLLKDQEEKLKHERIQYLKLKKITNDVLNKNN